MTNKALISKSFGLYGISDVAKYLKVTFPHADDLNISTSKLRYWIQSGASHISDPQFPTSRRLVAFQDVISMRMIAILRAKGIPLSKIRDMETWMRRQYQTDWPFAFRPMWTYQSDVIIEFERQLVAATSAGQIVMEFIREWLEEIKLDMTFDEDDIASTWVPCDGIRLDPDVQFGQPCVNGTGVPTRAIWSKIKAGDIPDLVAQLYDLSVKQVNDAIEWENRLAAAA